MNMKYFSKKIYTLSSLSLIFSIAAYSFTTYSFAIDTSQSRSLDTSNLDVPLIKSNRTITIPDKNLENALNDAIGQPHGSDITTSQLESLSSLDASYLGVNDISGLEFCKNLTMLFLDGNNITNLSPLSGLTKLSDLYLDNNKISDLRPLSNLTNLSTLYIGYNNISNIASLSSLVNLNILYLGHNKINDISTLSSLTKLTDLYLENNNIVDLSTISNLDNISFSRFDNQNVLLDTVDISEDTLSMTNPIKGFSSYPIPPSNISHGGVYNSKNNSIEWSNLNVNTTLSIAFSTAGISSETVDFSGNISIPIKLIPSSSINKEPSIIAIDKTLTVGDYFNPLIGVTAFDEEDGDLTSKITITYNNLNLNKPGLYKITYTVVDSHGASISKSINIIVEDIVNTEPYIIAYDKTLTVGDTFDPLSNIIASDEEDGDLTSKITITYNDLNLDKPGSYKITYTVVDSHGASISKSIKIIVEDIVNTKPSILASDKTLIVGDKFDPLSDIKAFDEEDGDLTSKITITYNNLNLNKPGSYKITYTVVDSHGTSSSKSIKITVLDIGDSPIITGVYDIEIGVGEVDTFDLLYGISVVDDKDNLSINDININGSIGKPAIGANQVYTITYSITDSDFNTFEMDRQITVTNQIPILTVYNNLEIKQLSDFNLLDYINAIDYEDGDLSEKIEILTEFDASTPGEHTITYQVYDSDNNMTTLDANIKVLPAIIEINAIPELIGSTNDEISKDTIFNPMDNILAIDKEDGDLTHSIKIIRNNVNTSIPGNYTILYQVTDSNKNINYLNRTITIT